MLLSASSHSRTLAERGYDLTFRAPKDASPAVTAYGVPNYAHVILFTPETKSEASTTSSAVFTHTLYSIRIGHHTAILGRPPLRGY